MFWFKLSEILNNPRAAERLHTLTAIAFFFIFIITLAICLSWVTVQRRLHPLPPQPPITLAEATKDVILEVESSCYRLANNSVEYATCINTVRESVKEMISNARTSDR